MNTDRTFPITRSLIWTLILPFLWMGLAAGVHAMLIEERVTGILWVGLVLLAVGVLIQGGLLRKLAERQMPFGSLMLIVAVTVLVALDEVVSILHPQFRIRGELYLPGLFSFISSIGFVVVTAAVAIRVVWLMRKNGG